MPGQGRRSVRVRLRVELTIHIAVTLVAPTAGVLFALQTKKRELEQVVESAGRDLTFHCTVTMIAGDDAPDFKGPHVNGPKGARFLYINSGEMAGQKGTCWSRRAKIHLAPLAAKLGARRGEVEVSTRFRGTAGDGGPACASVPVEWTIATSGSTAGAARHK